MTDYSEKGYQIYKNFFSEDELEAWEYEIKLIYRNQALKLNFEASHCNAQ